MTDRDYGADMRAVIDAETSEGPYVAVVVAEHIVEKLTATDPELLIGWLRVHAVSLVREAITRIDRSTRASARLTAGARRFSAAVDAAEDGDTEQLVSFLDCAYVVDEDDSRKRLGEMTAADLRFVADSYDRRAAENAMNATFMRALAKKVGKGRVSDHFTDEQVAEMWLSISGK